MVQLTQHRFQAPTGYSMSYVEWSTLGSGGKDAPHLILCVHGLTRNGRDFDYLAKSIVAHYEQQSAKCIVASVDILGRGESDWLRASELYSYATYVPLVASFIKFWREKHGVDKLDYVGTSMGGIIGMMLFAVDKEAAKLISKFVMNDIGAIVPKGAIARLGEYVDKTPSFENIQDALTYCKTIYSQFGHLTDEQWDHLVKYSTKADGIKWCMHYDPAIGAAFKATPASDVDLTTFWEAVNCSVLLLHGLNSDILTDEIIAGMQNSGPGACSSLKIMHFEGCGHAPSLMTAEQIQCVQNFLVEN